MKLFHCCFLIALLGAARALAIEKDVNGTITFNTTAPTNSDISNWSTGWPQNGLTGWDYVGRVNGASGVYLGNNWVLTAAHVGPGTFTLAGTPYSVVPGSQQNIFNTDSTQADLVLFQIATAPSLPALPIATSAPNAFSLLQAGSSVAMLGFGGGQGETWGLNTVTDTPVTVYNPEFNLYSTDFETVYGTTSYGLSSVTNDYAVINSGAGDSGGGDFIYNSSSQKWELAGINEAVDNNNSSYFVQLSTYASDITSITGTGAPEPSSTVFLGMAGAGMLLRRRGLVRRSGTSG